jgi:hypothetical protein
MNSNNLNISWSALDNGNAKIQIFDVLGRKVFENNSVVTDHKCSTTINEFPNQIYFVKVVQNDKIKSGKIILMK